MSTHVSVVAATGFVSVFEDMAKVDANFTVTGFTNAGNYGDFTYSTSDANLLVPSTLVGLVDETAGNHIVIRKT